MIQTKQNKEIETLQALADIIDSLNRRFPNGNNIFQRVSRLCEETSTPWSVTLPVFGS